LDVDENGKPFEVRQGYERGCSKWITITPAEINLEPKKPLKIVCKIKVPKEASGGYYCFVRVHAIEGIRDQGKIEVPFSRDRDDASAEIKLESDASVVALVEVRDRLNKSILKPDTLIIESGRIKASDKDIGPITKSSNGWKASLLVENLGNMHTQAKGMASIWSSNAKLVGNGELAGGLGYVFPNRKRLFTASGRGSLADGEYVINLALTMVDGRTLKKALPFYISMGQAYPGAPDEETSKIIKALSPGFQFKSQMKQINVRAGGRFFAGIPLENMTKDTLILCPSFAIWDILSDGSNVLKTGDAAERSPLRSWFSWDDNNFPIAPNKANNFKLRIETPDTLKGGEIYAGIIFNPPDAMIDMPEYILLDRMQLITLTNEVGLVRDFAIDSLKHMRQNRDEDLISCKVNNIGNGLCIINATLYLAKEIAFERFDPYGEATKCAGQDVWILPGGSRTLSFVIPPLEKSRYEGQVIVNLKQDDKTHSIIQRFTVM
jgi:hypothetical protein